MTMERRQKRRKCCAAQECTSTWSDMAWQQWNFYQQIMSNSNKLPHKGKCTIPKSRIPHIKKSKSCFKPFFLIWLKSQWLPTGLKNGQKLPTSFHFVSNFQLQWCCAKIFPNWELRPHPAGGIVYANPSDGKTVGSIGQAPCLFFTGWKAFSLKEFATKIK